MRYIIGIIAVAFLSLLLVISLCKAASDMDDCLEDIETLKKYLLTNMDTKKLYLIQQDHLEMEK